MAGQRDESLLSIAEEDNVLVTLRPLAKGESLRLGGRSIVCRTPLELGHKIASGAHLTLFSTGCGSVVGSAISLLIKVCANPETFRRMAADIDVDAGRVLEGKAALDDVGQKIFAQLLAVAGGAPTKSESLGHQESVLTYNSFEPIGPACLPV